MFTFRIDIAYTYVVSYWPSRDVKVIIFPNHTFLIHRYFPVLIQYFSTVQIFLKFVITFMRAVRSGVYNIHFGPVRPGLFSSQTYKNLGGESVTGRTFALALLQGRVHSPLCTLTLLLSRVLAVARA